MSRLANNHVVAHPKPLDCDSSIIHFCSSDLDECDTINGGCEQICTNAIGSFVCSCGTGYLLDGNGFNCTGMVSC